MFTGKDYPGFDMKMFENSNPNQCSLECGKVLTCTGFEYQYLPRRCWIKKTVASSGPNFKTLANAALYIRNIQLEIDGYKRYPQKDYPGHDIKLYPDFNREVCATKCDQNSKCLAFEFNIQNRNCFIKTSGIASGNNFKFSQNGELFIKQFKSLSLFPTISF